MRKTYTFLIKVMLTLCVIMTGSNAWAYSVTDTYVFTSKSWNATLNDETANWTSGSDGNQITSGRGIQITTGSSGANGTSPTSYSNVTQIVVRYCTNDTKGAGTIKVEVGNGTEKSFSVTKPSSGGTTLKNATFTYSTPVSGKIKVTGECTANSVYIYSVAITYEVTSTSVLSSIALSGDYPTTFTVGDDFSSDGITVTATYEDTSTRDVTYSASYTGYNMSNNGVQTVTVSYTEGEVTKTATYDINVKLAADLSFSETAISVDMGGTNSVTFNKATTANVSFEVEDETIAKYYPTTGIIAGLKEGTTTLRATSDENDDYAAGEAICTITVRDPNWIDFTAQDYSNAEDVVSLDGANGTVTFDVGTNTNNNNPKWYDSGSAVRIYSGNTITFEAKAGYVITSLNFSVTSGSMSANNFDKTVTKVDKTNEFTLNSPSTEITYSTTSNFRIDRVKISIAEPATITLASACTDGTKYYGTYSKGTAFIVPSDLTVSEITIVDNKLQVNDYETGAIVPANTGVMVSSATAGEHTVALATGGTSVLGDDNMLKASGDDGKTAAQMDAENTLFYRLTMHNGETIGYYWGAENGAAFAIAANKAYLAVPASAAAQLRGFTFDDVATSITDINTTDNTKGDNAIYNLSGQRVTEGYKGNVIRNGKKYLVK